ncbi:MAG: MarR family winged helix-turn-helix transcriptional regulator [Candidatus Zixiibacteriota bacterium]
MRRIVHAIDVYSRKIKTQNEITVPQLVCLLEIAGAGPLKISELARRVYLSSSTVVGIVDRLEERGLINRQRDPVDRRLVRVVATPAGVALSRQAPSPLQDGIANALMHLPELEQATIALSLERIVELMETAPLSEDAASCGSNPVGRLHTQPNGHGEESAPGTA